VAHNYTPRTDHADIYCFTLCVCVCVCVCVRTCVFACVRTACQFTQMGVGNIASQFLASGGSMVRLPFPHAHTPYSIDVDHYACHHSYVNTHTHTHIYLYIYIYTHIYKYVYVCRHVSFLLLSCSLL